MLSRFLYNCSTKRVVSNSRSYSSLPLFEPFPNTPAPSTAGVSAPISKFSELSNGIKVASISASQQPIASVGVYVNFGTRHETPETSGMFTILKELGFKSTQNRSSLRLVRELELLGANYSVSSGREHIAYTSEVPADRLAEIIPILGDVLQPRAADYEVERIKHDLEHSAGEFQSNARQVLFELLHQEAFRNEGLGRALVPPKYAIHHLSPTNITQFVDKHYTTDKIALVAVGGVDHDSLVKIAEKSFAKVKKGPNSTTVTPSHYIGGDARVGADSDTHVAIGFNGVSVSDKDVHALGVLQHLLGGGNVESARYVSGGSTSRLYKNLVGQGKGWIKEAFAFNVNYSDTGLFGVYAIAAPGHNTQLISQITSELSSVVSKQVDPVSLESARAKFKADILNGSDTRSALVDFVAQRAFQGKVETPSEFAKGVDGVTSADLQRVAKKVLSSRPTLAVLGDIQNVPTVESISKAIHGSK